MEDAASCKYPKQLAFSSKLVPSSSHPACAASVSSMQLCTACPYPASLHLHMPVLMLAGSGIVYPAPATAAEAASAGDQALEALQAVVTQPLPDRSKATPSKRKGSQHGMMIVICDEMDHLMSTVQDVLYDLFFLPQVSHCCNCPSYSCRILLLLCLLVSMPDPLACENVSCISACWML